MGFLNLLDLHQTAINQVNVGLLVFSEMYLIAVDLVSLSERDLVPVNFVSLSDVVLVYLGLVDSVSSMTFVILQGLCSLYDLCIYRLGSDRHFV